MAASCAGRAPGAALASSGSWRAAAAGAGEGFGRGAAERAGSAVVVSGENGAQHFL